MSYVQISTPFNIALDFEIAAFSKRLLATLLDLLILVLYSVAMKFFLHEIVAVKESIAFAADLLVVTVPMFLYHLVCEIAFHGQSAGKKAVGIRVMSLEGGDPTVSQYLLRWFFRVWEWPLVFSFVLPGLIVLVQLFLVGLFGVIVVIIIAVTANNQRLGDLAAQTVLVNTEIKSSIHDTIFMEVTDKNYKVVFPQVLKLSDRDINTIKTVLNEVYKKRNYDSAYRVADKIKQVLNIQSNLEVDFFLEQLIADYNYLATKE
jgi:uncharacterized RDD family membrane protein YckC